MSSSDDNVVSSNELDELQDFGRRKRRKRQRNPDNWKRNIQKSARQCGMGYINQQEILKQPKSSAVGKNLCSCRRNCNEIISDETRKLIFDYYYSVNQEAKDMFLFSCVEGFAPLRKRQAAQKHHKYSYHYFILVEQEKIYICRLALCSLLGISEKVIKRIQKSVSQNLSGPSKIMQGLHNNRPKKINEDRRAEIIEHINSFPTESSHYSRRKNPNRKYLPPFLTIEKMYSLYEEQCRQNEVDLVSNFYYREVFVTEFNLGFGNPRSDVCAKCDSSDNNDEQHVRNYKVALAELSSDRVKASNNENIAFITFDLQKTMPLPKISTNIAFYLRQLWFYNCGIHLVTKNENNGYMFTWTENEAGRGCEEICSSLLAFTEAIKGMYYACGATGNYSMTII